MVGAAVKVTLTPEQTLLFGVVINTDGVTVGFTVIVTVFDVALDVDTQLKLEIITQET